MEPPLHHQVCNGSEFLIRCEVQSMTTGTNINADAVYTVKIVDTFKSTPYSLPVGETVKLWTPGNDGICFASLTKGEEYYLGGKLDTQTGKLRIMLCDFRKKSSELKQCQKDMIKNKSFDCSCTDQACYQDC